LNWHERASSLECAALPARTPGDRDVVPPRMPDWVMASWHSIPEFSGIDFSSFQQAAVWLAPDLAADSEWQRQKTERSTRGRRQRLRRRLSVDPKVAMADVVETLADRREVDRRHRFAAVGMEVIAADGRDDPAGFVAGLKRS
jgi:hypothetical protein